MNERLKTIPEDFLVEEVNSFPFSEYEIDKKYMLFSLKKKGYTTIQATEKLAIFFDILVEDIGYSGLKDADGVTLQKITIPIDQISMLSHMQEFNLVFNSETKYLHLSHLGYSDFSTKIGFLQGNSFRLVIRNVDQEKSETISKPRKTKLLFPNYYGIQRFGIPGHMKATHLVGKYLVEKQYDLALKELICLGTDESEIAKNTKLQSEEFFNTIEKRLLTFYMNSYMSYQYNQSLADLLSTDEQSFSANEEDIPFIMIKESERIRNIYNQKPSIDMYTYYTFENKILSKMSSRFSFIETIIKIDNISDDCFNNGKKAVCVSFFLPSGCYATIATKQFLL